MTRFGVGAGEEITFTSVICDSAFSTTLTSLVAYSQEKPGGPAKMRLPGLGLLVLPVEVLNVTVLLPMLKNHSSPYFSVSLRVTSAIVASMKTCSGTMSSFSSAAETSSYSDGVA